jgi:hypothetical protein
MVRKITLVALAGLAVLAMAGSTSSAIVNPDSLDTRCGGSAAEDAGRP